MGPVESINGGKSLRIPIEAFKFPTNDEVEFMALVKPCQKQCEPAQCQDPVTQIVYNSYGRRRRSVSGSGSGGVDPDTHSMDNKSQDYLSVHKKVVVNDLFKSCPDENCEANPTPERLQCTSVLCLPHVYLTPFCFQ